MKAIKKRKYFLSDCFFVFQIQKGFKMLIKYKRNKKAACYDAKSVTPGQKNTMQTLIRGPFESCGDCPYVSHGFICYGKEGDCLRSAMKKISKKERV